MTAAVIVVTADEARNNDFLFIWLEKIPTTDPSTSNDPSIELLMKMLPSILPGEAIIYDKHSL